MKFSAAMWKRARNGGRVCLACSEKAWGWSRCSICHVKQAAFAFKPWLAQHRSCNGDQVCNNCWNCPIPWGSISKAVQRVAATQAKVARRAAEEKAARAIADVCRGAIAERKRSTEQESYQTQEAEPKAKHRRQENGREMTTEGSAGVRGKREDSNGSERAVWPTADLGAASAWNENRKETRISPICRKPRRTRSNVEKTTEQKEAQTGRQKGAANSRTMAPRRSRRRCWRIKQKQRRKAKGSNLFVPLAKSL